MLMKLATDVNNQIQDEKESDRNDKSDISIFKDLQVQKEDKKELKQKDKSYEDSFDHEDGPQTDHSQKSILNHSST